MLKINNIIGSFWHIALIIFAMCGIVCSLFFPTVTNAELYGSDGGGGFTPIFKDGTGIAGESKILEEKIVNSNTGIAEGGTLMDSIIFGIKYLLIFSGILAIIAFLYAGYRYIFSFGDDVDIAKQAMINAIIGIVVILFSWIIIQFLITFEF